MAIAVQPRDIDQQNHVNNTVYVRWIQEVATAHWNATAPAPGAIGWVVLRHEIDYKASACLGDQIVLRTWVGKATRLTFERFVEVFRESDRKLLAAARTLWVPINPQTGKPMRVPAVVRSRFSI
jgi:acyl-CoA thioester hydrolase